ncbi:MAG: beta-ketoacyl-ACP synthase III [Candidatus Caldatribacteriota bacterium]|jgi:3-oxoacyl-[acyl-carrier-protein] synthase-3|nr:ketoacyl-ACP synthase III [Atribacterota bacterium]MDD4288982.1 ketoacyl-ACP synthase III [Atribacterota bacterium]MDD5635334.1 ketoacyl-ACP synthase III [Atribacterota bacterium]
MFYSEIAGIGSCVPEKIVTNKELENIVNTSDQWIVDRTGIKERRISTGEKTYQIALKAAKRAIRQSGIQSSKIDLIILATITPDFFTPSTACLIQAELGLQDIPSFDISAGCTGFIYGLEIADKFIKSGQSKCILIIGAEVLSKALNWNDRNTCVLFGDGAGAAILRRSKEEGIISTYTGSQGDSNGFLTMPAVTLKNPFFKNEISEDNHSYIFMNGKEIFKFATHIMKRSIQVILKDNKLTIGDIDYIIPHQANYRIINNVAKKLKVSPDKFYKNMEHFGNTSAASIPLALDEMVQKKIIRKGNRIIMVGFGGGLTWGSILLNWTI